MPYGLSPQLFIENGPAVLAARRMSRSSAAWRSLDDNRRLALVEAALAAAANDDHADGYPVAL